MPYYQKADDEVQQRVQDLIGKNHPDLCMVDDEIIAVFRDKAAKAGGRVVLGSSKKATPLMQALAGKAYKFILEIPQDVWNQLDGTQRDAYVDWLLCACGVDENPKTGNLVTSLVKPHYMIYKDNYRRYGMWFPDTEVDDGAKVGKSESDVEIVLGPE